MPELRQAAQNVVEVWKLYGTAESLRGWVEILEAALAEPVHKCKKCSAYFERFSCGMKTIGECDCPKCQGYCECEHGIIS